MPYKIRTYSKSQAQKLGVDIKPSKNKSKKIDVFKAGKKVASIGALGMNDYPTYKELEKKKLYKIRHESDRKKVGTNGYYADKILW